MPNSCRELLQQSLLFDVEVNEKNEVCALGAVPGERTFQVIGTKKIDRNLLGESVRKKNP